MPSTKPVSIRPRRKAATRCASSADEPPLINPITGIPDCCAIAASGHALTEPRIHVISSRRRIALPKAQNCATSLCDYSRDLRLTKWGSGVSLQGSNPEPLLSALGQKRTFPNVRPMSALHPKADILDVITPNYPTSESDAPSVHYVELAG